MGKHHVDDLLDFKEIFDRDDGRRSPYGVCVDVDDILDGFFVHAEGCSRLGQGAVGGSGCKGPMKRMHYRSDIEWMQRKSFADSRLRCQHGKLGSHLVPHEGEFNLRCPGPIGA